MVVVALFRLMADAHLIDTKLGLVLVFAATQTPLATWLLHNHVAELPIGARGGGADRRLHALAGVLARRGAADVARRSPRSRRS